METTFLKSLGISNISADALLIMVVLLLLLSIVLIILNIVQSGKIKKLNGRIDALCTGVDGDNLEQELRQIIEENNMLMASVREHKSSIKNIYKRLEKTFQKMALYRYDAFHEMGGQLSFVLVLLDEYDNGFMINSVHSAGSMYTYCKEIVDGQSAIALGDEEAQALEMAMNTRLNKPVGRQKA